MIENDKLPATELATKQVSVEFDYLAPDGSEIRLLPEVFGGGLVHCTLPKGCVSKAVVHKTVEEIWYVISGVGQVWRKNGLLEKVDDVKAGTSLTIPEATSFQFRNTGEENLCIIITTIPRWPGPEEAVAIPDYWE